MPVEVETEVGHADAAMENMGWCATTALHFVSH